MTENEQPMRCKVYRRMGVWICDIPTVRRVACSSEQMAHAHAELFDSIYIESERKPRPPGSPAKKRTRGPRVEPPHMAMPAEQPPNNPHAEPQEGNGFIAFEGRQLSILP